MNRCITRADGEFTFAPTGNDRHISARDSADAIHDSIVHANETQAAAARIDVRRQIVESCEHREVSTGHAANCVGTGTHRDEDCSVLSLRAIATNASKISSLISERSPVSKTADW
jgi:hypothetical protein